MDDLIITLEDLRDWMIRILIAHRTSEANAAQVADALTRAEADGQKGHGLSRIPSYAAQSKSGKVDGHAQPSSERVGTAALRIDARSGFAVPALNLAVEGLANLAQETGIAAAAVANSHHSGVAGHPVEALARKGLIALSFGNTPHAIAPWGGARPLFGTNPLAFGAPRPEGDPLVIDMSLSKVARGKINAAAQKGETIPEGWAVDKNGEPTTDPKAALGGAMLAMGDAKGAQLALMVEIFAAALTSSQFGFEASSFFDGDGEPPHVGQFLIAIDPGPFSAGGFGARLEDLLTAITDQPGTRLPGLRRYDLRQAAARDGITIPRTLVDQLREIPADRPRSIETDIRSREIDMKSTIFAGAANWSAADSRDHRFGLFRLKSGSEDWENITNGGLPDKCEIRAIVVDPKNTDRIYVGTQVGPYRSENGGDTWTALTLPSDNAVTWSMLLHPSDPNILYAGTQDQGVFRSENAGKSWTELNTPEPAGLCRMGFPSRTVRMCLDPSNPDEVYAGVEVGGLLRSLDGGETWEDIGGGLLDLAKQEHLKSQIGSDTKTEGMMDTHATTISAKRPGTLIHATRMGLFRSDNKGDTWTEMGIGKHSPLTYARDVQVSVHDPDTIYAALSVAAVSDAGSLYKSNDFGENWSRFDRDVSVDSTMMHIGQSAASADCVFAGARRGQVFGTEDGGKSWTQMELPGGVQGVYAVACA